MLNAILFVIEVLQVLNSYGCKVFFLEYRALDLEYREQSTSFRV